MSLTYKGITPTLVVDTTPLQNNVQVAGTKWKRKSDGKFVATSGNEGICATLVASWLSMRAEGKTVTKLDQFPNNFALSIAQSSYEIGGSRESLLDVYGLSMLTKHSAKRKWYMFKKTRVAEAVNAAAGWPGFFYLRLTGDGGHALGIISKGTPQFLDPNEGILTFASLKDLGAWVSAYVPDAYPDLMEEVGLYAVGT